MKKLYVLEVNSIEGKPPKKENVEKYFEKVSNYIKSDFKESIHIPSFLQLLEFEIDVDNKYYLETNLIEGRPVKKEIIESYLKAFDSVLDSLKDDDKKYSIMSLPYYLKIREIKMDKENKIASGIVSLDIDILKEKLNLDGNLIIRNVSLDYNTNEIKINVASVEAISGYTYYLNKNCVAPVRKIY